MSVLKTAAKRMAKERQLYVMVFPGLALLIVFKYFPMYGILVAFQDYRAAYGISGSEWTGLKHFIRFVNDPYFFRIIRNTVLLGVYSLAVGFPAPIVLALVVNEVRRRTFRRVVQTISYMPHFLSTVIVVGLMIELTNLSNGIVNQALDALFGARINFFAEPEWFRTLYVSSGIWQSVGFGSIIYLAALSGVDPHLYEASAIDGAGRWRQLIHVTVPGIMPTIVILFILSVGNVLESDFQKIFLMYNERTYETADVVSTYVYRAGIEGASFSYASAVGLCLSVISFLFLYVTNVISRKAGETSLW